MAPHSKGWQVPWHLWPIRTWTKAEEWSHSIPPLQSVPVTGSGTICGMSHPQEEEGFTGIGLFQGTTTCTQEISEGTDRAITRSAVSFSEMENRAPTKPCLEEEIGPGDLQGPLQWNLATIVIQLQPACAACSSLHSTSKSIRMASREQGSALTAARHSPLSITAQQVQKGRVRNIFICSKQGLCDPYLSVDL